MPGRVSFVGILIVLCNFTRRSTRDAHIVLSLMHTMTTVLRGLPEL